MCDVAQMSALFGLVGLKSVDRCATGHEEVSPFLWGLSAQSPSPILFKAGGKQGLFWWQSGDSLLAASGDPFLVDSGDSFELLFCFVLEVLAITYFGRRNALMVTMFFGRFMQLLKCAILRCPGAWILYGCC